MKHIDTSCPYCGAPVIIDKKGRGLCEYCGQWVIYDELSDRMVEEDAYKAGYEFERGRQQARADARNSVFQSRRNYRSTAAPARRPWFLWVLGWIFIYPVPLMILMIRNTTLKPWIRTVMIVAGWVSYFLLIGFGNKYG